MSSFSVRRSKKSNKIVILIFVVVTIMCVLYTLFMYQFFNYLEAADGLEESELISFLQFEIPMFIHLAEFDIFLFTPTAFVTLLCLISSPIIIAGLILWEVRVEGDRLYYKTLTRTREYRFSDIGKVGIVSSKSRHGAVTYITKLYAKDGKELFSVLDSYVGYGLLIESLAARNIEGVQAIIPQQAAKTGEAPAQETAATGGAFFSVHRSKKARIGIVLLSAGFWMFFLTLALILYFVFDEPAAILHIVIFSTLTIAFLIVGIQSAYRVVEVDGWYINYNSPFAKRTLALIDIRRATLEKDKTTFYSKDDKKLFTIDKDDIGYGLFMAQLEARGVLVTQSVVTQNAAPKLVHVKQDNRFPKIGMRRDNDMREDVFGQNSTVFEAKPVSDASKRGKGRSIRLFFVLVILFVIAFFFFSALPTTDTDIHTSSSITSPNIDDVTVETGIIVEFGGIEWRVLDIQDDRVLLLSEYILEFRSTMESGRREIATWETGSLRRYLNTDMVSSFSPEDRERIIETAIPNKGNPWYPRVEDRDDTVDKLFLLSLDEVIKYFGDSGQIANRQTYSQIDDQFNSARIALPAERPEIIEDTGVEPGVATWWWLRTSGESNYHTVIVLANGVITVRGGDTAHLRAGLRPAMWVYLQESSGAP